MPPSVRPRASANRLLASLPQKDRARLLPGFEEVAIGVTDILFEPGHRMHHVHFPMTGYVSLVAPVERSARLEVALVGNEGMVGSSLALGISVSPLQALVQGTGRTLRMDAAPFRRALGRSPALQDVLNRYLFVRMIQLAQAAGCARFHRVEARLARWLLMTRDRAHSNRFYITHESMALMLGVRRAGVTKAASSLQKLGLIVYRRGDITILDQAGLRATSCACYRRDRESYSDMLG
jgi:CRP-like cAMP-binding protein